MRSGLTAVCVDDMPMEMGVITRILSEQGVRVCAQAYDGLSGLAAIKRFRPDIVTLDIILPQLCGLDVFREMLKAGITSQVFMASSMGMQRVKRDAATLGAKHFIVKPYDEVLTWIEIKKVLDTL